MPELDSFTDKTNPEYRFRKNRHGVVVNEVKLKKLNELNNRLDEFAQEWEEKYGSREMQVRRGEGMGVSLSDYGKVVLAEEREINPYKRNRIEFDDIESSKKLDYLIENREKTVDLDYIAKREAQYKANYIKMLDGRYNGIPPYIRRKIEKIPDEDFLELTKLTMSVRFDVDSTPLDDEQVDERIAELNRILDDFLAGRPNADTSLKIF